MNHRPLPIRTDVLVVGGRVAGAATAMLLARAGLDVTVVERSARGSDTLSTHALMRAGVLQLARWGLLDAVRAAGTPPIRHTTFTFSSGTLRLDIQPDGDVDALYAPRRTVLDALLADAAVDAGATVLHDTRLVDLTRDGSGRVDGGIAVGPSGTAHAIRARLVIGADGVRSLVARLVDAPYERLGTGASVVTYGYWRDMVDDGYQWVFRPGAAAGAIPTNDGLTNVFVAVPPSRRVRGADAFVELLAEASPELAARVAAASQASPLRTDPGRPGHLRRPFGAGWALVGDAGYYKDPLSAHGITDALRDAELLARAVVDGGPTSIALARYQAQRDALSADLFDVTDTIAGHAWTDAEIGPLLRSLSVAMAAEVELLGRLDDLTVPAGTLLGR